MIEKVKTGVDRLFFVTKIEKSLILAKYFVKFVLIFKLFYNNFNYFGCKHVEMGRIYFLRKLFIVN